MARWLRRWMVDRSFGKIVNGVTLSDETPGKVGSFHSVEKRLRVSPGHLEGGSANRARTFEKRSNIATPKRSSCPQPRDMPTLGVV